MKSTCLIFDVDGTLVNSRAGYIKAFQELFERELSIELSDKELLNCYNLHITEIVHRFSANISEKRVDELIDTYRKLYAQKYRSEIALFPHVLETITLLSKSCFLATATNLPTKHVKQIFIDLGIDRFFDHIKGTDKFDKAKPDPEILYASIDLLDLNSNNCFMIGDSLNDIYAGKNAGIYTIAVDYQNSGNIKLAEPNRIITSFLELPQLISSLSGSSDKTVVTL